MTDNQSDEENLRAEFESLGKNVAGALRSAWDAPESKRLRDEVLNGLYDFGSTLRRESENLANSQAAQQVKTEVGQLGDRLRSSDAQARLRHELVSVLQTVNAELQKVVDRWSEPENAAPSGEEEPAAAEPPGAPPVPGPAEGAPDQSAG
jgi:hypothetical protein